MRTPDVRALLSTAVVVVATAAAAMAVGVFVRAAGSGSAPTPEVGPSEWAQLVENGIRLGPAGTSKTVVVFSDYTCAYCKEFDQTLRLLRSEYPNQIAVVHRFFPRADGIARSAAIAAVCAHSLGFFEAANRHLFSSADTLIAVNWRSFAMAHTDSIGAFMDCLNSERAMSRIARDLRAGYSLDASATPTSVVNRRVVVGALPQDYLLLLLGPGAD